MSAGILGGIAAAALIALAIRTLRQARLGKDGWYALRPSWFIHVTLVGCILLLALFVWLWFNASEVRRSDPSERLSLALLIIGFGAGAGYLLVTAYARTVQWSDNQLRVRRWFHDDDVRDFSEISSIVRNDVSGAYTLTFTDGSRLQFPIAMHGSKELATTLGLTES
jgi:hypothetical protein